MNDTIIDIDTKKQEKKKLKMTQTQLCSVTVALLFLFLGFLVGKSLNRIETKEDFFVFVEGEEQVFRSDVGKKLYPLEVNGQMYLPINGLGSYLGYMTVNSNEDKLYLYEVEEDGVPLLKDFSTETLEGEKINSSVFGEADYTVFMLWGTWCKYCKEEIVNFAALNDYIKDNNIQFISVVVDFPMLSNKNELTTAQVKEAKDITKDFDFKYWILRDNIINTKLIGNTVSIPKLVIFDNQGNLIKIIEDNITNEEFVRVFDLIKG